MTTYTLKLFVLLASLPAYSQIALEAQSCVDSVLPINHTNFGYHESVALDDQSLPFLQSARDQGWNGGSKGIPGSVHQSTWVFSTGIEQVQVNIGPLSLENGHLLGVTAYDIYSGQFTTTLFDSSFNGAPIPALQLPAHGQMLLNYAAGSAAQILTRRPASNIISSLSYTCKQGPPPDSYTVLDSQQYTYGVLTGGDDTVKFWYGGQDRDVIVWVEEDSSNNPRTLDVGLYAVRTDTGEALTKNANRKSVGTPGNGEMLFLPNLPSTAVALIAVNSNEVGPTGVPGGAGAFRIRAASPEKIIPVLRAGFSFDTRTNPTLVAQAATALADAQRAWFTMSAGRLVIERVEITENHTTPLVSCVCRGGPCDVCFRSIDGRSFALGRVTQFTPYNYPASAVDVLAHELGHYPLGALDEYVDHNFKTASCHSDAQCGHSVMSVWNMKLCMTRNHKMATWPIRHVAGIGSPLPDSCIQEAVTGTTNFASVWGFFGLGPEPFVDVDAVAYRRSGYLDKLLQLSFQLPIK